MVSELQCYTSFYTKSSDLSDHIVHIYISFFYPYFKDEHDNFGLHKY